MVKSKIKRIRYFTLLTALACMTLVGNAKAEYITLDNIPKEKAEQIRHIVDSTKATPEQRVAQEAQEKTDKYAELGRSLGIAFKATATEMGISPEEFQKSNIGYFSWLWLAWELWLGKTSNTIANVLIGTIWMLFSYGIWFHVFKRICMVESTKYETYVRKYKNDAGVTVEEDVKATIVKMHDISNGDVAGYRFVFFIIAIIISIPGWIFLS
jgi:hypothetical protein